MNSHWNLTIAVGEPLDFNDPVVKHSVETIDKVVKEVWRCSSIRNTSFNIKSLYGT